MIEKTPRRGRSKALDESAIMFPKVKRKPRKTGKKVVNTPALDKRLAVMTRSGFRCERCGKRLGEGEHVSVHHRIPRGMGGTRYDKINNYSNLMALCGSGTTGCHGWIESNRSIAREQGFLVFRTDDPADVPALVFGALVYLNDEGGYGR